MPASNAVPGPAAFIHTVPPGVGARSTVDHGRRWGCSTGPTRVTCASIQAVASVSQVLVVHSLVTGTWLVSDQGYGDVVESVSVSCLE